MDTESGVPVWHAHQPSYIGIGCVCRQRSKWQWEGREYDFWCVPSTQVQGRVTDTRDHREFRDQAVVLIDFVRDIHANEDIVLAPGNKERQEKQPTGDASKVSNSSLFFLLP